MSDDTDTKPIDFNNDIIPMMGNFCIMEYIFAFMTLIAFYFSINPMNYIIVFILYTLFKLNYYTYIISNLYDFVEGKKIE